MVKKEIQLAVDDEFSTDIDSSTYKITDIGDIMLAVDITPKEGMKYQQQLPIGMVKTKIQEGTFKILPKGLTFKHYRVVLEYGTYSNGRIAIMFNDASDSITILKATVNVPEIEVKDNQVLIKDYSENEGVLKFLIENKIVNYVGMISHGHVNLVLADLIGTFKQTKY